jgi:alkyl sulfatase BDS1-like metallo-beta-lactamase superfamily hydrolase
VNPILWRKAQLNMLYGLFKVTDRIYQVRGYDLSNITFVQGDSGWIVFDPLISTETAMAAYDLVTQSLGWRPVVALMGGQPFYGVASTTIAGMADA